jgi:type IV secretory pathway TraG/TraD family ATPase VirD4
MFFIDEFPALGRLDELPREIATMAGYGVDFTLFVQGLDQLKAVYGESYETIVNNCAFQWFCNLSDLHSAEYLSKLLGKATVKTTSEGTSFSSGASGASTGTSTTHGETGRPLLMPDEILNLGRDTAILIHPETRPLYLKPVDYWELEVAFASLGSDNPFSPPAQFDPNPYRPR